MLGILHVQVSINFLLVGHTHEDIDAMFGTIMPYLRETVLVTPACVIDVLKGIELKDVKGDSCHAIHRNSTQQ